MAQEQVFYLDISPPWNDVMKRKWLITCWNDDASRMYENATRRKTHDMNTEFIEILNQMLKPGATMHVLSTFAAVLFWLFPGSCPDS